MSVPFLAMPTPFLTRHYLKEKQKTLEHPLSWRERLSRRMDIWFHQFLKLEAGVIMRHMNKRGILTSFWVVNEEDEMKSIVDKGYVAGIQTDRPAKLK